MSDPSVEERREALDVLHERLVDEYGEPRPGDRREPLDEVVFTILSQNTSDTNRDRAWGRLRSRYPDWQSVVEAPREELEEAIQVGGLQRMKAERIQELLAQVVEERGDYELGHLHDLDLEEARAELSRFKGLGEKSINCILLFSLGVPAFPVDTHVYRVLRRVGVHEASDPARANRLLQEPVRDEIAYPLHMVLIRHGREVCHARRPQCWRCAIEDLCGYDDKNLDPPG